MLLLNHERVPQELLGLIRLFSFAVVATISCLVYVQDGLRGVVWAILVVSYDSLLLTGSHSCFLTFLYPLRCHECFRAYCFDATPLNF